MFETNMELAHEVVSHFKMTRGATILDCVQLNRGVIFNLKTENQILQFEVSVKNVDKSGVIKSE